MKKIVWTTALLTAGWSAAWAQDAVETTVEADVVSHYVWRGQDLGHAAVQPTLGVAWRGLSLEAWGSLGIADASDTKELDLTLAYAVGGLNVGVTDYWFDTPSERYFLYDAHRTSHVFEANVGYDFGPVAVQCYTNFAGNDGLTAKGGRAYSTYVELAAPFRLGGAAWEATLGAVPHATTSYDTRGLAVVNVGLKATREVRVADGFTLPLFAAVAANPRTERAYLVVGVTLRP